MRLVSSKQPEPIWLFDLDNTLHNASHAIFDRIDGLMTQGIQQFLNVDSQEADRLRRLYWQRYGATLIGLVKHHGICAADFLHYSHDFDLAPLLCAEHDLTHHLRHLPGQKILLTNAPANYACRLLNLLGITSLFSHIFTIEDMQLQQRFKPKPSRSLMQQLIAKLPLQATPCIFVDDTLRNLKAAYNLGIKTVHFAHPHTPFSSRYAGRASYVDLRISQFSQLTTQWHRLLP